MAASIHLQGKGIVVLIREEDIMAYYVCTYGNFDGCKDVLSESVRENKYILHKAARYPSALDCVEKGDTLLLNYNHSIVAFGVAKGGVVSIPNNDWQFRVNVEKWIPYDEKNIENGVSSYGISWATLIGGAFSVVKKVERDWAVGKLLYMHRLSELPVMEKPCFELSISDVASWSNPSVPSDSEVLANVPILQRGLVWSPQQNELLWDSLFRRIPIGALVLCPVIHSQSRGGACTHHILDGQQRSNAISLGFDFDPFHDESGALSNRSILWLDLNPDQEILNSTSRRFLFRVTTPAHPWGYLISDEPGRGSCLSVPSIREAISRNREIVYDGNKNRAYTSEMFPFVSKAAVPMGFLTDVYLNLEEKDDGETFWRLVQDRLMKLPFDDLRVEVSNFICDKAEEAAAQREKVFRGLRTAFGGMIVAVNAPKEIVDDDDVDGQSTIEHLFTRINRQGTRLDGEELVYSTIKSYWPEVEDAVDRCANGRMAASRLLMLTLRMIETEDGANHYSRGVGISRVREIAQDPKRRSRALDVINNEIGRLCKIVDGWLTWGDGTGFPKVTKTAIAHSASELYMLLLILAWHNKDLNRSFVIDLTTLLYFFDYRLRNSRRERVIQHLLSAAYQDGFDEVVLQRAVRDCLNRDKSEPWLLDLSDLNREDIKLKLESVGFRLDDLEDDLPWWPTFQRFRCSKEMLLVAEAAFIEERFPDYDPARKDLWAEYNRPWDYDHVVAQNTVNSWSEGRDNSWWLWCVGNFAAIPLEENRSKSDENDWSYYDEEAAKYPTVFEVEALKATCRDPLPEPIEFRRAVWSRFLRLYNVIFNRVTRFVK